MQVVVLFKDAVFNTRGLLGNVEKGRALLEEAVTLVMAGEKKVELHYENKKRKIVYWKKTAEIILRPED